NDSGCTTGCVQRKNSLDGNVHGRSVESLKHNLRHFFSVGFRVKGSFGQKNRMLFGCNTELVVKCVVPDLLHIIPVGDDTVFDRVLQRENT
ncbi:hypothetical protein Angca_001688, partial [Angiostrongylus cantonensis]